MTGEKRTRRQIFSAAGGVAALAACAACGSGGESGNGATTAPPAGGTTAPAPGAGGALASAAEVPVGTAKAVKTPDGKDAIVARTGEATVAGFSAACTHQGATVTVNGGELRCPRHGSIFDAMTGAVKKGPAQTGLPSVPVALKNGQIVSG